MIDQHVTYKNNKNSYEFHNDHIFIKQSDGKQICFPLKDIETMLKLPFTYTRDKHQYTIQGNYIYMKRNDGKTFSCPLNDIKAILELQSLRAQKEELEKKIKEIEKNL